MNGYILDVPIGDDLREEVLEVCPSINVHYTLKIVYRIGHILTIK